MPQLKFETPIGAIDGVNTTFTLSSPYVVNSTTVYSGLLLVRSNEDGWIETSPESGIIDMKIAPLPGSDIQVIYTSADSVFDSKIYDKITCKITSSSNLKTKVEINIPQKLKIESYDEIVSDLDLLRYNLKCSLSAKSELICKIKQED